MGCHAPAPLSPTFAQPPHGNAAGLFGRLAPGPHFGAGDATDRRSTQRFWKIDGFDRLAPAINKTRGDHARGSM